MKGLKAGDEGRGEARAGEEGREVRSGGRVEGWEDMG